jgi:hypothetical protein
MICPISEVQPVIPEPPEPPQRSVIPVDKLKESLAEAVDDLSKRTGSAREDVKELQSASQENPLVFAVSAGIIGTIG